MPSDAFGNAFKDKVVHTATPATTPDDGQIDPTVKALVSAIGETETGSPSPDAYTKKGQSGEYGRYQMTDDTYKARAQKYIGDATAAPTIENQNKIQYAWVKDMKDQGYSPAQIASMQNAGPGEPNAYQGTFQNGKHAGKPSVGTNDYGAQYDVPAYTQKVSAAYQRLKGQQDQGSISQQPTGDKSFLGDVGDSVSKAGTGIATAIGKGVSGEINPLSSILQTGGAIGAGIGDVTNNALEHIPLLGGAYKGLEGLISKGAQAAAGTQIGQSVIQKGTDFATAHPELAGDIGAVGNIASAVPVLKGLGIAKNAAKGGISAALHGTEDAIAEAVAPSLTPKKAAQALIERGTVKKGLLRETQLAPDPKVQEIAKAVRDNVPGFDPSNPIQSIPKVQKAVTDLRSSLKADVAIEGAGKIYPTKQLISRLKQIEMPDLIASDVTLSNVYKRLINRVEGIARAQGGKVEKLPDILSEFDATVKKQYPNLYRSEQLTPLRAGVKDIRETIKTFAEENMPTVALKDRMLTVHKLITAMENMATKATKGAGSEIGTNAISRFGSRHPILKGLVKTGTKAAIEGTGIGAAMRIMQ